MKHKDSKKDEYKKVLKCPKCSSTNYKKRGFRHTKKRGKIQRYECKECGKAFIEDNGFKKMKNNPKKVTLCLDLFFKGMSLRKIKRHLQAFYPENSSHVSVWKWVIKYSNMISKFTNTLKFNPISNTELDEMEYTKGEEGWFIDSIDTETRFMVASNFVKERSQKEIKDILRSIKEKTESKVNTITTDGLTAYTNIVKKSFGYNRHKRKYNIKHRVKNASKGEGFNHKVERLHNSIRERTKIFRGFGAEYSAKAIMKGWSIYYNFIRKHQAIGKCPYELACPELRNELDVNNKWLKLIKLSKIKEFQ
ncbi:MAG: DDE-type integrase/transposase/recombinase [Candidatus Woesearchaeota archaeon]